MQLRDYQRDAFHALRATYASGKRAPIYVSPTGSGKTIVAAEVVRASLERGRTVLVLAPRIELLNQVAQKLRDAGIADIRTIQAENDNAIGRVIVASIQTFASKRWAGRLPPADIVINDECHHAKARTHLEIMGNYASSFLLGLSATPERGDGSPLGDVFDSLVVGITVKRLTELGHLVPCKVYAPAQILDSRTLALEPVDAYRKYCPDTKCVVFATTVEHAARIAEDFRRAGISSERVAGEMRERPAVIARYLAGEFQVLVNVSLVVEGFDDPAIASTIFARRFTHAGGYLQAIGRILRPFPGKLQSTVVDLCGSALVHGTPDLERTYALDGKAIRAADREAIRQCPACGGVFVARDVCPYCEHVMPRAIRSMPKASGVGVSEVSSKTKPTSWPMRAKRRGTCTGCSGAIDVGDWIVYSAVRRDAKHTKCAAKRAVAA